MHLRRLAVFVSCLVALVLATDWLAAQTPERSGYDGGMGMIRCSRDCAPERGERQLLYVGTPGTSRGDQQNGYGILVFDVRNNWQLIKRISTFGDQIPAWRSLNADEVKGMEIVPQTATLYLATFTGLSAFNLITEELIWERRFAGTCCDRLSASPDGEILYVPELGAPRTEGTDGWLVLDARTGATITKVDTPDSRGAHNTIFHPDGTKVFMAGLNGAYLSVADPATHTVVQRIGPFSPPPPHLNYPRSTTSVRPFTVNGRGTLAFVNVNGLNGFEVGDVETGAMLHRVVPPGFGEWTRDQINGEGNPSHGIAVSPDDTEIWVTDNVNGMLHVFDLATMPPNYVQNIELPPRGRPGEPEILQYPYWVTFGLDGRYAYPSTGHVIDAATKEIVGELFDEYGRAVRSEKMIEVLFRDGKMVEAADQFGTGMPATN